MIKGENANFNTLSEDLLLNVKMGKDVSQWKDQLKNSSLDKLKKSLNTDHQKKSFWINIYNAYYQILRKVDRVDRDKIYNVKSIVIASNPFSLDDIEHGILRKYRYKYSLGMFPNPFTPKLIRDLAVSAIDYRIHFALNCGAKSCPPIAFYKLDTLDEQLDIATQSFLESKSIYDEANKIVYTTKLLLWYTYDFGGSMGIRKMYAEKLNKDISCYKIEYNEYSWDEHLDNYASI